MLRASDLLRFRRAGGALPTAVGALLAGAASLGVRASGPAPAEAVVDGAFWLGMLCACWAGIRTLDLGLISDGARRLVTLGVGGGAVARYHLALSLRDVARAQLMAVAALVPWIAEAPVAAILVVVPGPLAALIGTAAHALAGEALDEGRNEGLKKALGGKFGAAEAAPLLYSGGGALALVGCCAVLLSASIKDLLKGGPSEPLAVILLVLGAVALWATVRAVTVYGRSFHAVVPRILEVAAPYAGVVGERPKATPSAALAWRLGGLSGATAWRDALQVRRAHRLDLPLRVVAALALVAWGPVIGVSPLWVAAGWGLVVGLALPTAGRAARPPLAPRWIERALRPPARPSVALALAWDTPVVLALGWVFGPAAAAAAWLSGAVVHGAMRAA